MPNSPVKDLTGDNGQRVAQESLEQVLELKNTFRLRDELHAKIDRVLFLENDPQIPKAYQKTALKVKSPLPMHIINTVSAALTINSPTVEFDAVGFGDAAEENAALRRRFFENSWDRQEQDSEQRILRRFIYSIASKGEGFIKTLERSKTSWAGYGRYQKELRGLLDSPDSIYSKMDPLTKDKIFDKETEKFKMGAAYPIFSLDIPPNQVYYIKGENGFAFVAEVKEVPYYSTLARYGASFNKVGQVVPQAFGLPMSEWARVVGQQTTLKMVEVWDWKTVTYILQGPGDKATQGWIVKQVRHGYGDRDLKVMRGPYFHAYGITTDSREIHKQGLSILHPFLDLFPLLDALLTIQGNAAFMTGFPAFKRKTPPNALLTGPGSELEGVDALELETYEEEEIVPGSIYPYDIEPINQPRSGVDLDKMISLVRAMLEPALPSVASGNLEAGAPGYAVNQALHQTKLVWSPIIDNAQFALSKRTAFESMLIENKIKEDVYVWGVMPVQKRKGRTNRSDAAGWLRIGPDDLAGVHKYSVKLNPESPSNETIELRNHSQKLELRLETPDMAVKAMGNDPTAVEKGWLLHEMKNMPEMKQQFMQRVWQELGTIDRETLGGTPPPSQVPTSPPPAQPPTPNGAMVPGVAGTPFSIGPAQQQQSQGNTPQSDLPPGTPPGMPGGIRNVPVGAEMVPGEG